MSRKCQQVWGCSLCTFQNSPRNRSCEMCGTEKNGWKRKIHSPATKPKASGKRKKVRKITVKKNCNSGSSSNIKNKTKEKQRNETIEKKEKATTSFTSHEISINKELKNIRRCQFFLDSYLNYKTKNRNNECNIMQLPEIIEAREGKENALLQIRFDLIKCASFYSGHMKLKNMEDDGIEAKDIFCAKCFKTCIDKDNDLLLCDGYCSRAYHQLCDERKIKTKDIPLGDDDWFCLQCDVIMEAFDHLSEIMFDGDKTHYKLYGFNDIYKLLVPELAIFQTPEDQHNKDKLIGLKLRLTKKKKKRGSLKYLNQSICKIIEYNKKDDTFVLEEIEDRNDDDHITSLMSASSSNASTNTNITSKIRKILLTSDELSVNGKRIVNSKIQKNNTKTVATSNFMDIHFSENDSDDEDYEISKAGSDKFEGSDSSSGSDLEDETYEEAYIVAGKSLRKRCTKVDYRKLAGEIACDGEDWGDSLLDQNYDPHNKMVNENEQIAAALKRSLQEK